MAVVKKSTLMTKNLNKILDTISLGLQEVIDEGRSLDQVCSYWIKQNPQWNAYEKGYFAETLTEVVRWWRLLFTIVTTVFNPKNKEQYRLMVLTFLLIKRNDDIVYDYFSPSIVKSIKSTYNDLKSNRAIYNSVPDWLDQLGSNELGELWPLELDALNNLPSIVLRVNTLKTTKENLASSLAKNGYILSSEELPYGIVLKKRSDIYGSKEFTLGLFEQQDASSQLVAPFLLVEPGMRVIDACAGNGGKTLHLACLMKNKGKILALDNADWKLEELMRRSSRAGVTIIEPRPITSTKVVKRLKDSADRLLLDVPCSGLGVLRRNPDSKWRLNPEKIEELKKAQSQILDRYTQMVKPGGKFVYSTCSILPSENQLQIQSFINRTNGEYILEEEKIISPSKSGYDGFYMARLRKIS